MPYLRFLNGLSAFAALAVAVGNVWSDEKTPQTPAADLRDIEFFERQVRPLLAERCFTCHGEQKQKAGLRLDSKAGVAKGSESGPVISPGSPDQSALIKAVRYHGDIKMPPTGKMPDEAIEALTAWVKRGAVYPEDRERTLPSTTSVAALAKTHWSFQRVHKPAVPQVSAEFQPQTAVDAYVFAELLKKQMTPAKLADRRTLIRRATFDLIGLPPRPEDIQEFVNDPSPDAFAKVIDRLLASPAYGERWGRHWLDVARYADTKGYLFMQERRFAASYTYRDYVVRAFNEDLPYDQFIVQQLAADQLPLGDDKRALAAMGYLTLGRRFLNQLPDIIDDRIDVVSRGMLGLTVSCARCHDHKYDPIPTADYYSLYGVFLNSDEPGELPIIAPPGESAGTPEFEAELRTRQAKVDEFLQASRAELAVRFRSRAADLLLAAYNAERPPDDPPYSYMLPGELPPRVVKRWQSFLETTRQSYHPVLGPWHEFAALPRKDFAKKAPAIAARVAANADPDRPINVLIARAFAERPPGSLRDVAVRYGTLFDRIDRLWRDSTQQTAEKQVPTRLPDGAQEAIRQVLYGDLSLFALSPEEIDRQIDAGIHTKVVELRRKVDEWRVTGPGAPPRAMVLADRGNLEPSHVFVRGNPKTRGPQTP
jgi:hypothetical protein